MATLHEEISRRRTFAIISHPDAGKTTLTEKFLLYGGAIAQAGEVKGKRARAATSDWMEIEKQRGISVTSSVMQFQHGGYCINILNSDYYAHVFSKESSGGSLADTVVFTDIKSIFNQASVLYMYRKGYVDPETPDTFGGSGSTLIACEQSGRVCRTMELDPKYVDVIRRRWAEFVHGEGCDWEKLTPPVKQGESVQTEQMSHV